MSTIKIRPAPAASGGAGDASGEDDMVGFGSDDELPLDDEKYQVRCDCMRDELVNLVVPCLSLLRRNVLWRKPFGSDSRSWNVRVKLRVCTLVLVRQCVHCALPPAIRLVGEHKASLPPVDPGMPPTAISPPPAAKDTAATGHPKTVNVPPAASA